MLCAMRFGSADEPNATPDWLVPYVDVVVVSDEIQIGGLCVQGNETHKRGKSMFDIGKCVLKGVFRAWQMSMFLYGYPGYFT